MKKQLKDSMNQNNEDEYIEEEEDEEEDSLLEKIRPGEYQVKERTAALRAQPKKIEDKKEKEPQDSLTKKHTIVNSTNHKVVEVVHHSKGNEDKKGPKDSVKK
jgi:hypothetical protein